MNKERRAALAVLGDQVELIAGKLEDIRSELETLREEEEEYLDNMPESFRQGEKGDAAEQAISRLDDAIGVLEGLDLESCVQSITDAQE